jgi:predicted nucleic acid-binding protein
VSARPLVVDASIVVEVLRRSERGDAVATMMRGATLAAPAHLDAEVLSALGRLVRSGNAEPAMVARALDRLVRLPVERFPIAPLVRRAWTLRENIALRDGLYVACAETLTATLLTLDGRLARSAPVPVETLPSV